MAADLPTVQRAWRIVRRGAPSEALILDTNFPVPTEIPTGEILVKIQAAALNPMRVLSNNSILMLTLWVKWI